MTTTARHSASLPRAHRPSTVALIAVVCLLFQAVFLPIAHAAVVGDRTVAWLELCSTQGVRLHAVELPGLAEDDPRRELVVHTECAECFPSGQATPPPPAVPCLTALLSGSAALPLATDPAPARPPHGLTPPSRASPI